jgi:MoaA/NifB/PqqE/SkfB family radical SAM enzyme
MKPQCQTLQTLQKSKILKIKEKDSCVIAPYDKYIKTDDYEIYFNTKTGFELIRGIHGRDDPFCLNLPSLLDIGIMGHCKNKCDFCYQGDTYEEHMKIDMFKSIIDQVYHHTNQVALGGRGDPNHHPHFKEIVEYCKEKNVVPNYTTSGIGLTDEQVEISKLCGAVAVSDYGKKFTYQAIKKFQDADIKTNIHFLFSRESAFNALSFLQGHDIWNKKINLKKLNAVVFLLFKPAGTNRGITLYELIPDKKQLNMFSDLVSKNKAPTKIGMDSCMVNHINIPKKLEMFMTTCEASRYSAYITPKGLLLPCSFMSDMYKSTSPISDPYDISACWKLYDIFFSFRSQLTNNPKRCPCGFNYEH